MEDFFFLIIVVRIVIVWQKLFVRGKEESQINSLYGIG